MRLRQPPQRLLSEPLICVKPESKVPKEGPKDVLPAHVVVDHLSDGGNAGIALEYSDLVVIDADTMEVAQAVVEQLPETFTVETGGNGFGVHYYFESPQWGRNAYFADGDSSIRSDGYMAVIPPSIHPDGGKYRVTRDIEPAEITVSELEQLENSLTEDEDTPKEQSTPTRRPRGGDLDELDDLIHHDVKRAEVRDALEDRDAAHNQRQFAAGFLLYEVGLSVAEVVQLIGRHNQWSDYDPKITKQQVESVERSSGGSR